jgi:hypothetical protein
VLNLDHVLALTDTDLALIARLSPHLASLAISRAQRITDEGVAACLSSLDELESLSLLFCPLLRAPFAHFMTARETNATTFDPNHHSTTAPLSHRSFSLAISADLVHPSLLVVFGRLNRLALHNLEDANSTSSELSEHCTNLSTTTSTTARASGRISESTLITTSERNNSAWRDEKRITDNVIEATTATFLGSDRSERFVSPYFNVQALPLNSRIRATYDGGIRYYDAIYRGKCGGGAAAGYATTNPNVSENDNNNNDDDATDSTGPAKLRDAAVSLEVGDEAYGVQYDCGLFSMHVRRHQFYPLENSLPEFQVGDIVVARKWAAKMFGWYATLSFSFVWNVTIPFSFSFCFPSSFFFSSFFLSFFFF